MFKALQQSNNKKAKLELNTRKIKEISDMVYPWNNHDFNYSQLIENKLNPKKIGISNKPYLSTFIKDLELIPKYPTAIIEKPLINKTTISGDTDVDPKNSNLLNIKKEYTDNFKEPYPGFKQEYPEYFPLIGEKSSSYFIKIGSCPVKSKKTKKDCLNNGYKWYPNIVDIPSDFYSSKTKAPQTGNCFKPRYLYIDNSPKDILGNKGPVSSITNDIKNLNPLDLISIFTNGKSNNKELRPLPCKEGFVNYKKKNFIINFIISILFIILCILLYLSY